MSKRWPTWLQNRPKTRPGWGPKSSWTRPRAKKKRHRKQDRKKQPQHKPVWARNGKRASIVHHVGNLRAWLCTCLHESIFRPCICVCVRVCTFFVALADANLNPKIWTLNSKPYAKAKTNKNLGRLFIFTFSCVFKRWRGKVPHRRFHCDFTIRLTMRVAESRWQVIPKSVKKRAKT